MPINYFSHFFNATANYRSGLSVRSDDRSHGKPWHPLEMWHERLLGQLIARNSSSNHNHTLCALCSLPPFVCRYGFWFEVKSTKTKLVVFLNHKGCICKLQFVLGYEIKCMHVMEIHKFKFQVTAKVSSELR